MKNIRWGILACGGIAEKFADDIQFTKNSVLSAVSSRSIERAKKFASRYGERVKAFGSYEEMLQSGEIDVVYIASPHGLHHEHTLLCFNHGLPVLCEKAFAINQGQVAQMIQSAREKNIYLMEALWTRFHPSISKVLELIEKGTIGEIKHIVADFGFQAEYIPEARWFNPELTGGSLMDIGIYPLFIAKLLLGEPSEVKAMNCSIAQRYASGATASLFSTFAATTDTTCTIYGDKGKIFMHSRFHETKGLTYEVYGSEPMTIEVERLGWGYSYEADAVAADLMEGKTENSWMTHQFSMELMQQMDEIRHQIGLVYPQEK